MNERLYNVVGIDDLEGYVFARCTTYNKALKAKELLDDVGFDGSIDIVEDYIVINTVKIDGKEINL